MTVQDPRRAAPALEPVPARTLRVGSRFRLEGPLGEVAVSSKKARAILAILAPSPRLERQQGWLAETLWGRSGDEHARNSLRGELSRLAKLLPAGASPLRLRDQAVSLAPGAPGALRVERGDGELLEGLRLPGEIGFDAWLRAAPRPAVAMAGASVARPGGAGPIVSRHVIRIGLAPVVAPGSQSGPGGAAAAANLVMSRIGHGLSEVGGIELVELRGATSDATSSAVPDVYLQCFAREGASGPDLTFSAVRSSDKTVVWTHAAANGSPDDPSFVSDLAERILARMSVEPRLFSSE